MMGMRYFGANVFSRSMAKKRASEQAKMMPHSWPSMLALLKTSCTDGVYVRKIWRMRGGAKGPRRSERERERGKERGGKGRGEERR